MGLRHQVGSLVKVELPVILGRAVTAEFPVIPGFLAFLVTAGLLVTPDSLGSELLGFLDPPVAAMCSSKSSLRPEGMFLL
jgi:hypothetical protein